jgi:hypothetical protein
MTHDPQINAAIAWAIAHPFTSASFFICAALWGNASDGARVPEWLLGGATFAAIFAGYFSIVRPWLFG